MKPSSYLTLAAWLFFTSPAFGRPLDVTNPSFESPILMPGTFTIYANSGSQSIPGWTIPGGSCGAQNCIGNYEKLPDGVNFAFNDGGTISQTLGTVQAGTYKLTVAIGYRPEASKAFAGGSIQLTSGNTVLKSLPLTAPKMGTFQDEVLECTVAGADPGVGAPLSIQLVADGPNKGTVDFDHVRLDFSGIEAPGTGVHSITVDSPYIIVNPLKSTGDTWMPAWRADGSVVSPSNDTAGFGTICSGNLAFNRIDGAAPEKLTGTTINAMIPYGPETGAGPDGCTWKSSGCLALDGTIYWFVGRHTYGETSGDKLRRQSAKNGSIIKSTDGIRWTRSAKENYEHPMFPGGRFAAAYFINYGQEGHEAMADGSDKYVYAMSNNGFWDNGDDVILGRVLRSAMPALSAADWQFYTGADGRSDANWTSDLEKAAPVISDPDKLGMTGAVYLPKQKCYLMVCWYYPAGGGKLPDAHKTTMWNFRVADHPWGRWRSVGTYTSTPEAFYCPNICPKFTSADGSRVWVFTAGDWTNPDAYRLHVVPLTIQ